MQLPALCKSTPGDVVATMLRVMKLTALILLIACLHVSAGGYSQTKVTLHMKDALLTQVFKEIRSQTGYNFFYQTEWMEKAHKVSIQVTDTPLKEALDLCFKDQPLSYTITGKSIVIRPKSYTQNTPVLVEDIDVRGIITDEDGNPLAEANIKVKGTNIGTTTNQDGLFILKNIDENAILEISYVGFEIQTVSVNNRTNITLSLKRSERKLDEIQIIAYGQTTKRLQTGNVSSVKAVDIQKQPVNNPLLALQGRIPGMVITQNTGVPGGGITIRIQGQNSLTRGNSPLYVIDGVPYTSHLLPNLSGIFGILGYNGEPSSSYSPVGGGNPLSFINPADIESIEVLKDADATSIYGSRAAQGAILITTKKGKTGKTSVDLNVQSGWGKVDRRLDLLNTREYLDMRHEAFANDGITPEINNAPDLLLWDTTRYTDWQKVLIGGTAHYTDARASVSGGTSNMNFLISAGYHRETTVFPGDLSDTKGSLHFNINHASPNRKFQVQLTGNYLVDNNQLIANDLTEAAIKLPPNTPAIYNADGTLNWALLPSGNSSWYNPFAYLLEKKYNIKTNNLTSNVVISYQVLPGLDIKSSFGYTNLQTDEVQTFPLIAVPPEDLLFTSRFGLYANNNANSWIIEPQVTYKRVIGKIKLDGLAGVTIQQNNSKGQQLYGSDYPSDEVIKDINSAATVGLNWPTVNSIYKYNAVFGRINLNWQDKYIVNLTARRDGSSRFGPENQFHNFGSVAGVWIFSNEAFIQKKRPFFSFGKLRVSYGTTGSDQIGDYQFMSLYSPFSLAAPYQGAASLLPTGLPNPYLEWEETKKLQLGLDIGFFNDRILLNTNYYHNRSSNQLHPYSLPATTGRSDIEINFPAVIQNTGWEFLLNTRNIESRDFSWSSSINLTIPRNELVAFPDLEKSSYADAYVIGEPITIFKAFAFTGVDPATGLYQFRDKNGNITSTPDFSTDRTVLVNTDPKFYGGFQNSFRYKSIELDLLFQFTKQTARNYLLGIYPGFFQNNYTIIANQPVYVLDRWQKTGDISAHQRFSATLLSDVWILFDNARSSDRIYSDASYIRLKNLSLSWQLPATWKQKIHLQNARIYAQGQNLLTITNYKGMDPEITGIANLPPLRILTFGMQIGL